MFGSLGSCGKERRRALGGLPGSHVGCPHPVSRPPAGDLAPGLARHLRSHEALPWPPSSSSERLPVAAALVLGLLWKAPLSSPPAPPPPAGLKSPAPSRGGWGELAGSTRGFARVGGGLLVAVARPAAGRGARVPTPHSACAGIRSCGSGGSCSRPASTRPPATAATTATAPWRMARKSLESGCSWRRRRGGVRSASTCATCPW